MITFPRRVFQSVVAALALAGGARGQGTGPGYTDPVGYTFYTIPGNSETLLPLQLCNGANFKEYVTEVTATGIRLAKTIPTGVFGSNGRGFVDVRTGTMAGLAIPATGFSGNFLNLERSPVGLIFPGDFVGVHEELTLGRIFGRIEDQPFQTGLSAQDADNVSIWDARTQSSRVFYVHTGLGWREAGKANEGDKSNTMVLFPSGVIVRRRTASPVDVLIQGTVIVPWEYRYHPVWPGRNIISAPFTDTPNIAHYIRPLLDAPHTVISADSAPKADTLRFFGSDGSISPVLYFRKDHWCVVGSNEDAGNTSLNFIPCLDLQRVGGAGYLRFEAMTPAQAVQAQALAVAAAPVTEVRPVTLSRSTGGLTVAWPSEPGVTYQVQTKSMSSTVWSNLQAPVLANASTASMEFHPAGNGCIRVIQP